MPDGRTEDVGMLLHDWVGEPVALQFASWKSLSVLSMQSYFPASSLIFWKIVTGMNKWISFNPKYDTQLSAKCLGVIIDLLWDKI